MSEEGFTAGIELDEVTIRRVEPERPKTVQSLLEFPKPFPPGTRTKETAQPESTLDPYV